MPLQSFTFQWVKSFFHALTLFSLQHIMADFKSWSRLPRALPCFLPHFFIELLLRAYNIFINQAHRSVGTGSYFRAKVCIAEMQAWCCYALVDFRWFQILTHLTLPKKNVYSILVQSCYRGWTASPFWGHLPMPAASSLALRLQFCQEMASLCVPFVHECSSVLPFRGSHYCIQILR